MAKRSGIVKRKRLAKKKVTTKSSEMSKMASDQRSDSEEAKRSGSTTVSKSSSKQQETEEKQPRKKIGYKPSKADIDTAAKVAVGVAAGAAASVAVYAAFKHLSSESAISTGAMKIAKDNIVDLSGADFTAKRKASLGEYVRDIKNAPKNTSLIEEINAQRYGYGRDRLKGTLGKEFITVKPHYEINEYTGERERIYSKDRQIRNPLTTANADIARLHADKVKKAISDRTRDAFTTTSENVSDWSGAATKLDSADPIMDYLVFGRGDSSYNLDWEGSMNDTKLSDLVNVSSTPKKVAVKRR